MGGRKEWELSEDVRVETMTAMEDQKFSQSVHHHSAEGNDADDHHES